MSTDIKGVLPQVPGATASQPQEAPKKTIDQTKVEKAAGEPPKTGISNIRTEEGRQAFQKTLLDLGLNMPEFMNASDSKVIKGMSEKALTQLGELGTTAGAMTSGNKDVSSKASASLQGRWADFVSGQKIGNGMDVNALVQFVLREAYMENTKDLHFYAQKVRFFNQMKKNIRNEVTKAREFLSTQAGKEEAAVVDWYTYTNSAGSKGALKFSSDPALDENQCPVPQAPSVTEKGATKEGVQKYIEDLEQQLNSIGDDAQLANVDLQNMLQKQQQTLQMMSNIAKMLHDTAMAIIRKIGS